MLKLLLVLAFISVQAVTIRIMCLAIKKLAEGTFRTKAQETIKQQKNMHYESWKNVSGTSPSFPECLQVLGFTYYPEKADEIKNRYKDLARRYHPDMGGNAEEFKKLKEAYDKSMSLPKYRRP